MSKKIQNVKTRREYDLEFEGKEIAIFYYLEASMAFLIDVDNMLLFAYDTIYNTENCIGKCI